MTPAINNCTIEVSDNAPYKIIGIEGGIMIARDAVELVSAAENCGVNPRFFIAGINTEPVAATSATAEPDISAKNSETVTFTIAKPPRINPTNARQKSINLRLMLVVFIKQPARINKGIAINGKFVAPSNKVSAAL